MAKEVKKKLIPLSEDEKNYILNNYRNYSAAELAKYLHRDARSIKKWKDKLLRRNDEVDEKPSSKMTEAARKRFFQTQLTNNTYYDMLKRQFTKEEIDFYLEEWGTLCLQFEDIVATEKRQIDELIKTEIMGSRTLINIKVAEEEILKLQEEIDELRSKKDVVTDEEAQERDSILMMMVKTMASQSQQMHDEYQKNVTLKNKILDELKGRRKDRIEQLKKSNTTFLGLVGALRERDLKEKQGRHAELLRMAKEKKKKEWRSPATFPDGSRDCILVDSESKLPERNSAIINDTISNTINKYASLENEPILIIDNDMERIQFFQTIFNKHNLSYASNNEKAIEQLKHNKFKLVCFDYDLGLQDKGDKIAEFIKNENILENGDFLVHSMNKDGAEKISALLSNDSRNVEVVSYGNLLNIIRR